MAQGIELRAYAQQSLAAASVGASFTAIGSPLLKPMRMLLVQNYTDALLQFSFDGVVDHFVLPSMGQFILDVTANQINNASGFFIGSGTQMYVEQIGTPTTGSVYVSSFYANGA